MPLFRCDTCGCVENTAMGLFHDRDADYWPENVRGRVLCSACAPATRADGQATGYGAWHGQLARRAAAGMLVDQRGHLWHRDETGRPASVQIGGEAR
ncbi:hypothetical protein [Cupriavidus pampae]|uniref:Uncharacterized protein n=1 Tax=Cupriavidus pampae TaxID=659251 RepID=A0ABM8XU26_9BURK|nr:hypothetical protein [Cupriavidus pampae]CAG9183872.1 hypothetical protein LMG32289_05449 [Cupriavidus pampae]